MLSLARERTLSKCVMMFEIESTRNENTSQVLILSQWNMLLSKMPLYNHCQNLTTQNMNCCSEYRYSYPHKVERREHKNTMKCMRWNLTSSAGLGGWRLWETLCCSCQPQISSEHLSFLIFSIIMVSSVVSQLSGMFLLNIFIPSLLCVLIILHSV